MKRLIRYPNVSNKDKILIREDNISVIKWHVDPAFVVHLEFKSHTGGVTTMEKGALQIFHIKMN